MAARLGRLGDHFDDAVVVDGAGQVQCDAVVAYGNGCLGEPSADPGDVAPATPSANSAQTVPSGKVRWMAHTCSSSRVQVPERRLSVGTAFARASRPRNPRKTGLRSLRCPGRRRRRGEWLDILVASALVAAGVTVAKHASWRPITAPTVAVSLSSPWTRPPVPVVLRPDPRGRPPMPVLPSAFRLIRPPGHPIGPVPLAQIDKIGDVIEIISESKK